MELKYLAGPDHDPWTSWNDAGVVVELLVGSGFDVGIDFIGKRRIADIEKDGVDYCIEAPTVPTAIMLAACRALDVEVDGG